MKIKLFSLVLLSSLAIAAHATEESSSSSSNSSGASLQRKARTTPASPLGKLAGSKDSNAPRTGGRFAALVYGAAASSSMSQSTPVPSSNSATPFDPFGTLTADPKSSSVSTTLGTATTTTPAVTTSTPAVTTTTSKSSPTSILSASGIFGDDDDLDGLFVSSATATASKATTITKSDHEETLRLLEEQFKAAEENSSKVFQGKITDLSKELLHVQAALTAAKKENGDKDQQLVIVQGLHDTQKAEVTRLQSELKAKKDELATLEANAAKGSSVVDAEKIQQLTAELEKSNKELDDSKALLKTLNQENDRLVTDKLNLKGEIDAKVQSLAKLTQVQADLTAANQRVTEAERLKGVAETELAAAKLRLAEAEHLKDEAEAAKIQAEGKNKTDGEVIKALKKDLDQAQQYVTEAKDRLTIVEEARAKLQGEFNKAEANIKTLQGALTTAEKKNTDLKDNLAKTEAEKAKVESNLSKVLTIKDNAQAEVGGLQAANADLSKQNKEAATIIAAQKEAYEKLDDETAAEIAELSTAQTTFLQQLQEAVFGEAFRTAQAMTQDTIAPDDSATVNTLLATNPFFTNLMKNPFISTLLAAEVSNNSPAPTATSVNTASTSTTSAPTSSTVNAGNGDAKDGTPPPATNGGGRNNKKRGGKK